MKLDEKDPWLSRSRDHLAMAIHLRSTARKLKTVAGKARLAQLAALYEQLSLCYLEESCSVVPDRRPDGTREVIVARSSQEMPQLAQSRGAGSFADPADVTGTTRQRH